MFRFLVARFSLSPSNCCVAMKRSRLTGRWTRDPLNGNIIRRSAVTYVTFAANIVYRMAAEID